ncbi:hypothetical protein [Streptoalloteichus tenebrarius]|uniref:hypothetical protein n=1 Tax=Streptoalloteichus tenebrarius (strain ATCC 17920 / DSM 40477 / JCM 4838 / CBS 697.72 / NBRC 16177 / NCIMB 11028 / NRRL B-12390 / A12253. 1 / ISP 5477) TaxID=1933 RepID=UPI0020A483F9|nr:hypothetical protein [Streptoalloteichus tenebrarius]BFE99839.1 hypothetical protein GCM10020241_15150 [Streptoalloteichus tenebrarius]
MEDGVDNRFWRWSPTATLTAAVVRVRVIAGVISELDWEVSVDFSSVRAHQHTTGANQLVMLWAAPFSSPSRPDLRGQTLRLVLKDGRSFDPGASRAGMSWPAGRGG